MKGSKSNLSPIRHGAPGNTYRLKRGPIGNFGNDKAVIMTSKEPLRKTVKKLMVDLDLDYKGVITDVFTPALGIRRNVISMALTGYRDSEFYQDVLGQLHKYLVNLPHPASRSQNIS